MRKVLLIVVLLMLGACATWSTSNVKDVDNSSAVEPSGAVEKSPQDIIITEADITDREYKVLGNIEVNVNKTTIFHSDPTREKVNEKLKHEAAKIGANAVILVRYGTVGISALSWGSLNGKGRAIAFVD